MKMPKEVRKAMRAYNKDLLRRVRKVACPHCGAGKKKKCIGQYNRETAGCHADRHIAAKRAGHVRGTKGYNP